jgi:molecular chaperone HscB
VYKNYFEIFGLEPDLELDKKVLDNRFFKLITAVHPDKFIKQSKIQQELATGWSALINDVYKILKDDFNRAVYLLGLQGIKELDADQLSPAFLMETMEWREELAIAKKNLCVSRYKNDIAHKFAETFKKLLVAYHANDIKLCSEQLTKLKFLNRFLNEIKNEN